MLTYPPDFTFPARKQITAHVAAQSIAGLVPSHRAVVQAGGCVGLWPLALSHYFDHVYTFEPEPTNFACLRANVQAFPNVSAFDCALGETRTCVGLTRPKAKAGLWHVEGPGEIPQVTLDDFLGDVAVDAVVLDVEGAELRALRGAERLITTHRPMVWLEYLHHTDAMDAWLTAHDYTRPVPGIGGDFYSVHMSRVQ